MSKRVEIIRRLNAELQRSRRDWLRHYAEDVEFRMPPEWPDDRVFYGPEEIARGAGLWSEQLDDYVWEEVRLVEAEECVLGLYHHTGHIRGTEQRVESEVGALFYFTGEKISRVVTYGTWAETLRAAGMDS